MNTRTYPGSGARWTKGAYSVIEVLVAVTIMGIMFVSLYSGMSSGFAVVQLARENLRATQILQEKMETIRLYRWDQVITDGFIPTNFTEVFFSSGTEVQQNFYTGLVTVARAPFTIESYSNDVREVKVVLRWNSAEVDREREMSTFVSKYGLQNYVY